LSVVIISHVKGKFSYVVLKEKTPVQVATITGQLCCLNYSSLMVLFDLPAQEYFSTLFVFPEFVCSMLRAFLTYLSQKFRGICIF